MACGCSTSPISVAAFMHEIICEPVWASSKAGKQMDLGLILLQLSFLFKKVVFVDTVLWPRPSQLIKMALIALLMQESFWWWQCSDMFIISLSLSLSLSLARSLARRGFCCVFVWFSLLFWSYFYNTALIIFPAIFLRSQSLPPPPDPTPSPRPKNRSIKIFSMMKLDTRIRKEK